MMRLACLLLPLAMMSGLAKAEQLPIFDAHIHYSHDAVEFLPPKEAIKALRAAGLKKALVSSSDDNGTQLLFKAAPDLIVPALRPYRKRGETGSWMHDETILEYVETRLARNTYRAIGEFHAFGNDIDTKVIQRIIVLAKEHGLLLHAHSDAAAIDKIFASDPDAMVLWAHSGFDRADAVRAMLAKHKNLWSDLAYRSDQASDGKVTDDWRKVFEEFPKRFMVGTDTFAPEQWHYVKEHADYSRKWLASLPRELAERIAFRNSGEMLARLEKIGKRK